MDFAMGAARTMLTIVGANWIMGWAAAFVVMTFESSRPKADQLPENERKGIERLAGLAGATLPVMLLFYGFVEFWDAQEEGAILGFAEMAPMGVLVVLIGVLVFIPFGVGWLIGKAAPGAGRFLASISVYLAFVVFAAILYFAWEDVMRVLDLFIRTRMR